MTNPIDRADFNPHTFNEANPVLIAETMALAATWRDAVREANDARAMLNAKIMQLKATGHSYKQISEATDMPQATIQKVLSKAEM